MTKVIFVVGYTLGVMLGGAAAIELGVVHAPSAAPTTDASPTHAPASDVAAP